MSDESAALETPGLWTFRRLATSDFEMLGGWLSTPAVARWWAHDPSPAAVDADFGPSVRGDEPTEVFIAERDGHPTGLIQRYWWHSYPTEVEEVVPTYPIPAGAFSIDYLIGESNSLGRGRGPAMIDGFVNATFAEWTDATTCIVAVHDDNRASWRALEHAGFRIVGPVDLDPDNPIDDRRHLLARRDRGTG